MKYSHLQRSLALALLLMVLTLLSSCSQQTTPSDSLPTINKVRISDITDGDTRIEVYADAPLHAGYNPLYVRTQCMCDKSILRDAHVELEAEMQMPGGVHTAPVEQPESLTPDADGLFHCAVVCTMPSQSAGDWHIKVGVHNHKTDTEHEVELKSSVQASSSVQVLRGSDGNEYFCVCYLPQSPKVGLNDCRFWIYHHNAETQIMAMNSLALKMGARMTDMNMSSVGHTQPVIINNGEYRAQVNFSMRGGWAISLDLQSNTTSLGKVNFPLSF